LRVFLSVVQPFYASVLFARSLSLSRCLFVSKPNLSSHRLRRCRESNFVFIFSSLAARREYEVVRLVARFSDQRLSALRTGRREEGIRVRSIEEEERKKSVCWKKEKREERKSDGDDEGAMATGKREGALLARRGERGGGRGREIKWGKQQFRRCSDGRRWQRPGGGYERRKEAMRGRRRRREDEGGRGSNVRI
jgi:hypothetical protein